jgi:inhibitor of KinA
LNKQYTIFPLGDCAATIELGKGMSAELNKRILAMQKWFEKNHLPGIQDTIVAYSSLTLVYDPITIKKNNLTTGTAFESICNIAEQAYQQSSVESNAATLYRIPVCYDEEFGIDLPEINRLTNLPFEKIIELHISRVYRVYMLGFLPGFAYMGELDPVLNMPRKQSPVTVAAGSVGIASNQTGIYPLNSPGGWQIIGRTHVKLFELKEHAAVKFEAGDEVQFYQITREQYEEFKV